MDNEFALPNTSVTTNNDVKVHLKSTGSITNGQVQQTVSNSKETRLQLYGDLKSDDDRKCRPFQERVWATNKNSIGHSVSEFLAEDKDQMSPFVIVGVNKYAAYAIKAVSEKAKHALVTYKTAHANYEADCFDCYFSQVKQAVKSKNQAKSKLDLIQSLMRQDAELKDRLSVHEKDLKRLQKKLPETSHTPGMLVEKRPGEEPPDIVTRQTVLTPVVGEDEKHDDVCVFELYTCVHVPTAQGKTWSSSLIQFCDYNGGVPSISVSDQYAVVMLANQDQRILFQVYHIFDGKGKWSKQAKQQWVMEMPIDVFGSSGQFVSTHLHPETHQYVMGIGTGLVTFNVETVEVEKEATFVWMEKQKRTLSCVSSGDCRVLVFLATTVGECFGVDYKTGVIRVTEVVPACEPILSVEYSNLRTIMHSISSVSGCFTPYHTEALRQIEVPRPRAMRVVGTLLFVLDKYGAVYIFSTVSSNITFPFKAPKNTPIGIEYPCQVAYQGVYATPTLLVVVYANGVVQRFEMDVRMQRMIEQEALMKKKKKTKATGKK